MNKIETNKILKKIIFAYPKTYEKYFSDNSFFRYDDLIELWQEQFSEDTFYLVHMAINNLIKTNKFAPTIADIRAEIEELKAHAKALLLKHKKATDGIETTELDILTGTIIKTKHISGTPLNDEELLEVKKILDIK